MRTLKILGLLLTYPGDEHIAHLDECVALLRQEKWLPEKSITALTLILREFQSHDLLDLQESYVDLFDRTPSLSLHLFEHIHGDSRDRGQALADLKSVYDDAGLTMHENESPDYLPLFLEYLSSLPIQQSAENLGSIVNILSVLAQRLKNRDSSYAAIFDSLIHLADKKPSADLVKADLEKSSGAPLPAARIDQEWEEQFAFDNTDQTANGTSGCPKAEEMLARIKNYQPQERV